MDGRVTELFKPHIHIYLYIYICKSMHAIFFISISLRTVNVCSRCLCDYKSYDIVEK